MRCRLYILAMLTVVASASPVLAQPASERDLSQTRHTGPYNTLPDNDRRIVSAIYEAQLESPNDLAGGRLLRRDDIAALRGAKGWSNAYARLFKQGMVGDKTLSLAIDAYNRSIKASRGITVINTGSGEQLAFTTDKRDTPQPSASKPPAKPSTGKPAIAKTVVPPTASGSATGTW